MTETTKKIKKGLWEKFSTTTHPSEWDALHGGGKMSQRFWEYFKAIELLDLGPDSVLLDIGGGSPITGVGFFAEVIGPHIKKVIILDPNIHDAAQAPKGIEFIRERADSENFKKILQNHPELTHVASVSVFEHIEPTVREKITTNINDHFAGSVFVATYEYHSKRTYFESQLTTKTVSDLFTPLTNFYLTDYCACPTWSPNAFVNKKTVAEQHWLYQKLPHSLRSLIAKTLDAEVPAWYPVAVKFERV